MTVDLYMHWRTPYNPAVAGLTVEAWEDSLFSHSPVGNPSAYPPASSPTATTTTDSSGNCELTGLTAGTNYYVSIIDENNRPWFVFCPSTALGNLSTTRRQFSIVQGPVAAPTPIATGKMSLTTHQNIASGAALTPVTFDVNDWALNGVTYAGSPSFQLIVPTTGYYIIEYNVEWDDGYAVVPFDFAGVVRLLQNASTTLDQNEMGYVASTHASCQVLPDQGAAGMWHLTAADTISVVAGEEDNAGTGLDIRKGFCSLSLYLPG